MNAQNRGLAIGRVVRIGVLVLSVCWVVIRPAGAFGAWKRARGTASNTAFSGEMAALSHRPVLRWSFLDDEGGISGSYISTADVDGDGAVEIVVGSRGLVEGSDQYGLVWLVESNGDLKWKSRVDGYVKWASPVMIEIDGDGLDDIVVGASWWSALFAFSGATGDTLWTSLSGLAQVGMNAGDIDGDDLPEIVVADYQNPRTVRLVNRQGTAVWPFETTGTTYNIPAIGILGSRRGTLFTSHAAGIRESLYFLDAAGGEYWRFTASPSEEQLELTPPELGYLPDYGYVSAALADFDADGENEVGFGTDLNYYVLDQFGEVIWKKPIGILSTGFTALLDDQGDTVAYLDHHYQIKDAAVVDLNGDGAADVVHNLATDWWGNQLQSDPMTREVTDLVYRNGLRARSGIDGGLLWEFNAPHSCLNPDSIGRTGEPVACVYSDGALIIAGSNDGYLYGVDGATGEIVWEIWGEFKPWDRGMALIDLDGDDLDELLVVRGNSLEAWSELRPPVLSATLVSAEVELVWGAPDPAVSYWRVYRGHEPVSLMEEAELLATLPVTQMSYVDDAAGFIGVEGMNAFYAVVGVSQDGATSGPSNTVGEWDIEASDQRSDNREDATNHTSDLLLTLNR